MRKRKINILFILLAIVLFFGLGYAYLNTTLNISGTTDVDSNTWNVYWDNVQVTSGSVTASTPTIDTNLTTVSFSAHLSKPGDFYEFTVDAVNDGTIDAMIDEVIKTINSGTTIPAYLNYTVTYSGGTEISQNQLLEANSTETYKVRVEYRTDINPSDLPSSAQSFNLVFGITYIQGDNNAVPVESAIYSVSGTSFEIGYAVPEGATTYNNYQDAITEFGHPFFLKHIIENNIIVETYLGFILDGNVYYLRAGVDESSFGTMPIYESNKEILLNAFGSSNCSEASYYYCSYPAFSIAAYVDYNSYTRIGWGGFMCDVDIDGCSHCGEY